MSTKTAVTTAAAATAEIRELITWETTNDFRVKDLVCENLNLGDDRVRVDEDGTVVVDGIALGGERLIDLANRLPA